MSAAITCSVILAIVLGITFGEIEFLAYPLKELGTLFVNLLKMIVVPIAFVSITGSIIKIGSGKKVASLTLKALAIMAGMSLVGVALGLSLMNFIGVPDILEGNLTAKGVSSPTFLVFIVGLVPTNPFMAFVKGNMLQVITFSCFVGWATLLIPDKESVGKAFSVMQDIILKIANIVMYFAPIGVFSLLYPIAAKSAGSMLEGYVSMIIALIIGSIIYMVICSIPVLKIFSVTPIKMFRTIIGQDIVGAIAGGATNYMAPRLNNLENNTNIPKDVLNLLIPFTSVLMRAGSCICVGIYTVFTASVFNVELTPEKIAVVMVLTLIALTAAPGIIGGTLMDCAIVWAAIGIPLEAVALLAGIDYVMDILRTVLNIQGGEIVTICVGEKYAKQQTDN